MDLAFPHHGQERGGAGWEEEGAGAGGGEEEEEEVEEVVGGLGRRCLELGRAWELGVVPHSMLGSLVAGSKGGHLCGISK